MEDVGDAATAEAIPIPNVCYQSCISTSLVQDLILSCQVNATVLKKVIEWCQHHRADPPASTDDDSDSRKKTTDIEEWDQKFMQVDQEMLFEIILVSAEFTTLWLDTCTNMGLLPGCKLLGHQGSP